jgi:uncharacterized protein (UPF0548 family)
MIRLRRPELDFGGGDVGHRVAALRDRPLNFDPATLSGPGWEHDDYRQELPREQPGSPEPGGSWEVARELSRAYAFADPALVEARYDPAVPLEQRDMLLILHALGARIYAGCRVGGVEDGVRTVDGREARVFAWNYQTLEGHVESGRRDFEVRKWLDTGEVEFRTFAVSRPAEASPVVRFGFRLLGRHKQVEFGRSACRRMLLLTEASLRRRGDEPATAFDGRLLAIYVRDHHGLLVVLRELGRRMEGGSGPAGWDELASAVCRAAEDDLAAVEAFLERLESAPARGRAAALWTAEKLGRLKLNGRIVRRSPLSPVTELEGCRILLESARALWAALDRLAIAPIDAADRAERAAALLATAEQVRLAAVAEMADRRG